jgi:hypothetical protein
MGLVAHTPAPSFLVLSRNLLGSARICLSPPIDERTVYRNHRIPISLWNQQNPKGSAKRLLLIRIRPTKYMFSDNFLAFSFA